VNCLLTLYVYTLNRQIWTMFRGSIMFWIYLQFVPLNYLVSAMLYRYFAYGFILQFA